MDTIETLIPDDEGNHLVVVLYFYDDDDKIQSFQIPIQYHHVDIADININKLDLMAPLKPIAFFRMCHWLQAQFRLFPNAVFSFICSNDPIESRHFDISPEQYRWNLFDRLYDRYKDILKSNGIIVKDIIVGPTGYETFARVFYRDTHSPIIHLVTHHLTTKYSI